MDTGEDLQKLLREIRIAYILTKSRVSGQQSGVHLSRFKGQGIEFSEIREYLPGDDIRAIDWKVTARTGIPHVKEFTEERDQTTYIILDMSASGSFGTNHSKFSIMIQILSSITFGCLRYHDRTGLILVTDKVELFIPARTGRRHVVHLINKAINFEPVSKRSDLIPALIQLLGKLNRMTSIVIISDFYVPDCSRELSLLARRHEVMAIRVQDIGETEMPDVGLIELEDSETSEQILIDTSDPNFRRRYREACLAEKDKISLMLKRCHIKYACITTESDYMTPLKRLIEHQGFIEVNA